MKSILIPTDFSAVANYVLLVAEKLAHKENSRFSMLHTYDSGHINALPSYRDFAVNKMRNLLESHHLMDMPHRCYVREGNMGNCVNQITHDQPISLVVMGKNGAEENVESEIVLRSACPVLAVPQGSLDKVVSKIVYITENLHREKNAIKHAIHFSSLFEAGFTLLNIQNSNTGGEDKKKTHETFPDINYDQIPVKYIIAENLIDGLRKYLNDNRVDIVAVAGVSGGWLGNNKRKHYMKQLLAYPGLPLLFINNHTDDE